MRSTAGYAAAAVVIAAAVLCASASRESGMELGAYGVDANSVGPAITTSDYVAEVHHRLLKGSSGGTSNSEPCYCECCINEKCEEDKDKCKRVALIIGAIMGVITLIGIIAACVCIKKRRERMQYLQQQQMQMQNGGGNLPGGAPPPYAQPYGAQPNGYGAPPQHAYGTGAPQPYGASPPGAPQPYGAAPPPYGAAPPPYGAAPAQGFPAPAGTSSNPMGYGSGVNGK